MTPMTVRSVPRGLQRDAWWMAADAQTGVGSGGTKAVPKPLWLLLVLLICTDLLVLRTAPGLGFVGLIIILAAGAHWVQRDKVKGRRAAVAWAILIVAVLPAIDVFQFISFASAWGGLTVFAVMLVTDNIGRAVTRLPLYGA